MIKHEREESRSVWMDNVSMPKRPKLTDDLEADVCVIGAGVGGLTTAYMLANEGLSVCVLEGLDVGGGQTGRTTAHFVTALDDRYFELERIHGRENARVAAESHTAALEKVADIVGVEKIDCELARVDGYLFAPSDGDPEIIYKELEAVRRAGLTDVNFVKKSLFSSFETGPAICFPRQIQLHPLKYLRGLCGAFEKRGGRIFTGTHVTQIHGGPDTFVKTRDGAAVRARHVVVATNTPINDLVTIHTKQAPYRTYVTAFEIPKESLARALYWDTLDPYHYLRLEAVRGGDKDLLIVGGEDHKTGQNNRPNQCFERLENWVRERFPQAGALKYRWSGQVMEPVDGLAFLGHNPLDYKNVYVITGDSGNGMTHCTIGGILITDEIMGRPNPWENLYKPSRKRLRASREFLRENLNVAEHYADWLKVHPLEDLDGLPAEQGAVFSANLKRLAIYRDTDGTLDFCSAACPHLGCVVTWNNVEKTWDCPCHGSRFDRHGNVIEGPAVKNLEKIEPAKIDELTSTPAPSPVGAAARADTTELPF